MNPSEAEEINNVKVQTQILTQIQIQIKTQIRLQISARSRLGSSSRSSLDPSPDLSSRPRHPRSSLKTSTIGGRRSKEGGVILADYIQPIIVCYVCLRLHIVSVAAITIQLGYGRPNIHLHFCSCLLLSSVLVVPIRQLKLVKR